MGTVWAKYGQSMSTVWYLWVQYGHSMGTVWAKYEYSTCVEVVHSSDDAIHRRRIERLQLGLQLGDGGDYAHFNHLRVSSLAPVFTQLLLEHCYPVFQITHRRCFVLLSLAWTPVQLVLDLTAPCRRPRLRRFTLLWLR
jgi:hypothetical protein